MKISDELHLPIIAFLYVNIGYINSVFFYSQFAIWGFCVVICALRSINVLSHMPKHIKFLFQSIVGFNAQPRLKSQIQHTEIHSLTLIQFISKLEISQFWNFVSVFSSSCAFIVSFFSSLLSSHFVVPFHMTRNTFTWFILARRAAHTHFWYETQIDVLVHAFTLYVKMCAKI